MNEMMMVAAHMMDPTNLDVLGSLAQSLLRCGQHQEALQCAEAVLDQVPGHRGHQGGGHEGHVTRPGVTRVTRVTRVY